MTLAVAAVTSPLQELSIIFSFNSVLFAKHMLNCSLIIGYAYEEGKCFFRAVAISEVVHSCREISIKGDGALLVVQSSISFLIIWFGKHDFFQQLSLELIDNCISVIIIL